MKLNGSSVLTMEERSINGDPRISLIHAYAEEWNLQIQDIDEDDAGVYRCFINNGKSKTLTLEVKGMKMTSFFFVFQLIKTKI